MPRIGTTVTPKIPKIEVPTRLRFTTPTFDLYVPDNLGHAPTVNDVEVRKGFDGKTPDEAVAQARKGCTSQVNPQNEAFLAQSLKASHKSFTLAVNNAFIPNSPFQKLAAQYPNAKLSIVGTPSSLNPVLVKVEQQGKEPVYFSRSTGTYQAVSPMTYPVAMQAEIRLSPPGVALTYPKWKAPQLAHTASIFES